MTSQNDEPRPNDGEDHDDAEKHSEWWCAAYGCPLNGTIAFSVSGADRWYCAFHVRAPRSDFDVITHALRRNFHLYKFCRALSRLPHAAFRPGNADCRHLYGAGPERALALQEAETLLDYRDRIMATLRARVKEALRRHHNQGEAA